MPSIPQSLLWISLVVLWLFVLVPMLISKRDAVRRTSDVALATRVLNGGGNSRLLKRPGPAAGHRSDPDWKPEEEWDTDRLDGAFADADTDHGRGTAAQDDQQEQEVEEDTDVVLRSRSVVTAMARTNKVAEAASGEPDYLDVDVVDENAAALPLGASARAEGSALLSAGGDAVVVADQSDDTDDELADDEYEYIEDSSGLEPEEDDEDDRGAPPSYASGVNRRRRFENKTAAVVSARKYAFRKRMLVTMAVVLVGSAIAAFEVTSLAWWICGIATTFTMFYLSYLRRQTKIEERVRRRRMQRMSRSRLGVENTQDREYDLVPSRLRRPGAVVLEIDDEDPIFEHLEHGMPTRNYGYSRDLARAAGQ